jgi:hypothetical protein
MHIGRLKLMTHARIGGNPPKTGKDVQSQSKEQQQKISEEINIPWKETGRRE